MRRKTKIECLPIDLQAEYRSTDPEAQAEWMMVDRSNKKVDDAGDNIPLKTNYLKLRNMYLRRAMAVEAVLRWEKLREAIKQNDKRKVCEALPYAITRVKDLALHFTPDSDTADLVKDLRRLIEAAKEYYRLEEESVEFYTMGI